MVTDAQLRGEERLNDDQIQCYECKHYAMPMMTVEGPKHGRNGVRHFCCLHCFWQWIGRVIKSRDSGGRLDRQIDWS